VNRIKTLHVLLVMTFRPEFEPPWIGRPHLGGINCRRRRRRRDRSVDRGGALFDPMKVGNRAQEFPAMTEQDAQLLQVLIR
jgi:hypothetical protein